MKLNQLKDILGANPQGISRFILPDGDTIPAHFHITEVGHVAKRFIDCGGAVHHTTDTCVLQTYVADDVDHRLTGEVFAKILDLGEQVLPHDDLEVEIEYDCCVVSQYGIASGTAPTGRIDFYLISKQTDCLAKSQCGIEKSGGGSTSRPADDAETTTAGCC